MSRVCWSATVEKYSQPYSAASAIGEEARPNIALIGGVAWSTARPNNVMFHIQYQLS